MRSNNKLFRNTLLFCTVIIIAGCAEVRQSQTNTAATITFGQGGGVTGKYTEYSLVVDGILYSNDLSSGQKTQLQEVNKKTCRVLFIEAEQLDLLKMDFNHPFNINYYIIFRKGIQERKINWGDARNPPPDGVKELYDKLMGLVKQ